MFTASMKIHSKHSAKKVFRLYCRFENGMQLYRPVVVDYIVGELAIFAKFDEIFK